MSDESVEGTEEGEGAEAAYSRKKVLRKVAPDEKLPFTVHLEELRWRLIYSFVTVVAAFAVLYTVSDSLFQFIRKPIGADLVFLAPAEAFFVYLKLSFYIAIIVSMPMILYQAWEFVAPGLMEAERKYTGGFVVFGSVFFLIGASFCYFIVLPFGLDFLLGYGGEGLTPMISVSNYVSFVFKITIAFGVIFELPIVIVFLTRLGVVTPNALAGKRSYFIVGAFILASILTPPDVFTQVIMAAPMILLFEISIFVSRFFIQKAGGTEDE